MIVFDDMTADMIDNKKLDPIVTELFIRGRKFYHTILFRCSQKYESKFNTLFCYENSKQKTT